MNKLLQNIKWVAIAAILWNLLGVMAYLMQLGMDENAIAKLSTQAEKDLYKNIPTWYTLIFGIAVFTGLFGSLSLFFKKKISTSFFMISFLAVLVQMYYNFFIADTIAVFGLSSIIMPMLVLIVSFFLVWYSRKMDELAILS